MLSNRPWLRSWLLAAAIVLASASALLFASTPDPHGLVNRIGGVVFLPAFYLGPLFGCTMHGGDCSYAMTILTWLVATTVVWSTCFTLVARAGLAIVARLRRPHEEDPLGAA